MFASINNNEEFVITNLDNWNNNKEKISNSIKLHSITNNQPSAAIKEILKVLFDIHKTLDSNVINTYIIDKKGDCDYCLFCYEGSANKNTIISHLIDNSYQPNYEYKNSLNHDNYGVVCKINNKELLDITKDELIEIIQHSFICRSLIINPFSIDYYYYTNNPVYGLSGFDVYTVFNYNNYEIRIYIDVNDNMEFVEYESITYPNKKLYRDILTKWNVFKNKDMFPKDCRIMISLHKDTVNISIDEEKKQNIINFLTYNGV